MKAKKVIFVLLVCALVVAGYSATASAKAPGNDPANAAIKYQTKVFIRGAAIHGANGLAVDKSGRLLVASVFGGELVAVDTRTGKILERLGHNIGGAGIGVDSPDDVAVGPDGSIYWTDIMLGQVGRRAPNGEVTKQFVAPGMNPIAFTADGRLFVGQAFMGDGLYELNPNTLQVLRVVIPDSGAAPFINQLNGFDFGPDGMLYSPQPFLGQIVKINPESGVMETLTEGLFGPTSVEFDSQGRLYSSLSDGTIIRINTGTGAYKVVTKIRDAVLDNMVFDARDRLFVSNSDNGAVYAVAPGGGVRTLVRGGLILPGGAAVMAGDTGRESLFVADVWSLAEFDVRSGRLLDVDRQSRVGASIVEPWSVAPDGGNVIVTSWMSNAIQVWDPVSEASARVVTDENIPVNAIRFRGDLVVAELMTGSVVRYNAAGTRSVIAAIPGIPTGLAATDDDLWVANFITGEVLKIVADGVVLASPQPLASGLSSPEGMAVDRDGSLLVVDAGAGRLVRIDPGTGGVTTVADELALGAWQGSAGAPPTWSLSSVAVAKDGTIFVTGDLANVVYRIRALPASQ